MRDPAAAERFDALIGHTWGTGRLKLPPGLLYFLERAMQWPAVDVVMSVVLSRLYWLRGTRDRQFLR